MMELVIDCGNTRIKTGLFKNGTLEKTGVFPRQEYKTVEIQALETSPYAIMVSSVIDLPLEFISSLRATAPNFLELSHETPLPFRNTYKTITTLGKDRICGVAGAMALSPNENSLVIDAGTCVTFDVLINGNTYIGGSISPGLHMRLRAMHKFTDRLPSVAFHEFMDFNGLTTEESMLAGAFQGMISEVDGLIDKWRNKIPGLNVYLTGGDGITLAKHLKSNIFAEPNLILSGLHKILLHNVK